MAVSEPEDRMNKYAPLIAIALGASATLLKNAAVNYTTKRKVDLGWSDLGVAAVTATITYISFRRNYGSDRDGWYKR